jgi:type IV secretory pathway ATPase VirB11/archaellum biosynthesis ATPase
MDRKSSKIDQLMAKDARLLSIDEIQEIRRETEGPSHYTVITSDSQNDGSEISQRETRARSALVRLVIDLNRQSKKKN